MNFWQPKGLPWQSLATLARPTAPRERDRPLHVFLCLADHFEPKRGGAPAHLAQDRVARWRHDYPRSVAGLADSAGRSPRHTFFYPAEEYEPDYLDLLAEICRQGLGEVEVHLHHNDDTSDHLRTTLVEFKEALHHRHGLLSRDAHGEITYGFIHGNWALDNSRRDGRWCGVNDELTVLRETGCYADFTMPSAPEECQTSTVNAIYYASDDRLRPKSHDRGQTAAVHRPPPSEGLLMIQGPLLFDWRSRKWALLPRLENGELHGGRPPSIDRFWLWLRAGVTVEGQLDWRFVKLHTHGAHEANTAMLLGEPMRRFHESLAEAARRDESLRYYYVSAREMADLVHQAEQGALEPVLAESRFGIH
ncbi:MAG TPA: hypothetical protein VHC22_00770 [Pirellulales bacterium]|nr:hypothetical protein [Pirellulales bacterium]